MRNIFLVLFLSLPACAGSLDFDGTVKGSGHTTKQEQVVEPLRSSSLHSSRVRVLLNEQHGTSVP